MNIKKAKEITGGLSNPSKMPGYGYNLPAVNCITGSKLCKIEGTVCNRCYARKGRYSFHTVQKAMKKRRRALKHPKWVECMTFLIDHYCEDTPYFRFHDSGDIQNITHLHNIFTICKNLPHINFWLPTLENQLIKSYFKLNPEETIPENLNIRLSTPKINYTPSKPVIKTIAKLNTSTSSVSTDISLYPKDIICPATLNHTDCGECRK